MAHGVLCLHCKLYCCAVWETNANQTQECKGPFDDGRYFLRGDSQDPVCVKCEERRLKA
jgi:hypothetical protein